MTRKHTTEQIFETATSDSGMNIRDTVRFHAFNPNGLVAQLPTFDDFVFGDLFATGLETLYGRHNNYHAKWLDAAAAGKRASRWEVGYHLKSLREDIVKARETIAAKRLKIERDIEIAN